MPSPEPMIERNAAIVAALEANPLLTLQAVGDQYGITRERVRQIYKRATKRNRRPRICRICGASIPYRVSKRQHATLVGHGLNEWQYRRNREWEELYEDGLSTVQIARIYGTSASAVGAQLNRYGRVKMRPQHQTGGVHVVKRYHLDVRA